MLVAIVSGLRRNVKERSEEKSNTVQQDFDLNRRETLLSYPSLSE
jgi:hypothetical protein